MSFTHPSLCDAFADPMFSRHMAPRTSVLLTVVSIMSIITCWSASLLASDAVNVFDLVDDLPINNLPVGSYNVWSMDERAQAHKLIVLSCARTAIAFMQAVSPGGAPKERVAEELKTFYLAYRAMHLPKDHPDKAVLQLEAMQHYQAAKALGSLLSPPTFPVQ